MSADTAAALAAGSAPCFGLALISGRRGLRGVSARAGAAVSIPTAAVMLAAAAPFALDPAGWSLSAALMFAFVGLFFPGLVALLTLRSNAEVGPTVTVRSRAPRRCLPSLPRGC